jgi:hypothetical protein
LNKYVPKWAGLETEVGEIKGKEGMSTVQEALFLIQGLNAHGIYPDWIALNNGTAHGIQTADQGIQVELTAEIHQALKRYKVSGAQHGTSGNDSDRLRRIAKETLTTKANVATALQMITWGVKVNDYGNAVLNKAGNFLKRRDQGVTPELWKEMLKYAQEKGLKGGNFKKLNLPFENKIMSQPKKIRDRSEKAVADFVYGLLTKVFNAKDTAPLGVKAILKAKSYNLGSKAKRIEKKANWNPAKIRRKAKSINSDKGPKGDFED